MLFTAAHELTHFIKDQSPEKFQALADFLMEQYGKKGVSVRALVENQIAKAKKHGKTLDYDGAFEEVVADSMETMLTDGKVLQELRQQNKGLWQTVKDYVLELCEKIRKVYKRLKPDSLEGRIVSEMRDAAEEMRRLFMEGLVDAGENFVGAEKNTNQEDGTKYSLREFQDGIRFVDVEASPNVFDGLTVSEMNRKVKNILMDKFAGKVIGIDNRVFVNGDSVNEYLHPSKSIDMKTRTAKLTAAGELDNLLDAGRPLPNEADGRDGHVHPDTIDFSYYKTIFKVGEEYFEGIVNVKNIKRGKLLKDVTKIRNITEDIVSSYGKTPKSNFLRDASTISIRSSEADVKRKFSMREPVDVGGNFRGAEESTTQEGGKRFSFRDSHTGMANDSLLPYNDELKSLIENGGGVIVNNFEKLQEVVNAAFAEPDKKATAYFGILDSEFLEQIEKKVPNIPKDLGGKLFKPDRNYSIAVSMDSIRHLTDDKALTSNDVIDYLDRMADTIIDNDTVAFDYYTDSRNNKLKGLLFKKIYSDGTMVSFELISSKKMSLNLQTMYMDKASYQKKKSAKTPLVQNTPAHTPEARVSQTSMVNVSQPTVEVKQKFSVRDQDVRKMNEVLEKQNEKLREDVASLKELLKLQRSVTGGKLFTDRSLDSAAKYLMQNAGAKGDIKELNTLLRDVYSYIAGDENVSWDGIMERAEGAANWLEEHREQKQMRDPYADEVLREIRGGSFHLDEQQKQEAAYQFGRMNCILQSATGTTNQSTKGTISKNPAEQSTTERKEKALKT